MTFKHQTCSGFPSVSFIVEVIAALNSQAHILIMRLLSRPWPLAKIAQNQLRQLLSYGKTNRRGLCSGLDWLQHDKSCTRQLSLGRQVFPGEPVSLTHLPELGQAWASPSCGSLHLYNSADAIKIASGWPDVFTKSKTQVLNVATK